MTARALGKLPDDLRTLCNFSVPCITTGAPPPSSSTSPVSAAFPRERLSVFARGRVAILDDFGKLTEYFAGKPRTKGSGLHKSMGHAEELEQFVRAVKGEPNHLLSWEGSPLATLCMFAAQESIRSGAEIDLDQFHRFLLDPVGGPARTRRGTKRPTTRTRPSGSARVRQPALRPQFPEAAPAHERRGDGAGNRVGHDRQRPAQQGHGEGDRGCRLRVQHRYHHGLPDAGSAGANTARNPIAHDSE